MARQNAVLSPMRTPRNQRLGYRCSGHLELRRPVGELLEHVLHALEHLGDLVLFGQDRDPEMVAIARVEARARRDQDMLLLEQLHRERLVVEARELLAVDADERIHRTARRDELQEATLWDAVDHGLT